MLESIIKNYDELPLFLNAKNLSKVLGLSESSVYELMHEKDFPSLCIGSRLVVPKEHFKKWVDEQIENIHNTGCIVVGLSIIHQVTSFLMSHYHLYFD